MQPVLVLWPYVGECAVKFLANFQSHTRFVTKIKDACEVGSSRRDIASYFLPLVREETLTSMSYFLLGVCKEFQKPYVKIIEQHDHIAQKQGHIARHVAVQFYAMHKQLDALEASYEHNDLFLTFLNRQNMHSTEEKVKPYSKLPPSFFTEEQRMTRKHFTQCTHDDNCTT